MNMSRWMFLFFCAAALPAGADDDPLAPLKRGQPKAVADLIERIVLCNHWGGEEAFDAARGKEIAGAMADLRCERLPQDEARAEKRYARQPRVLDALRRAREASY